MTIKELKDAIQNTQYPDWFKNISLNLNFIVIGVKEDLQGFSAIYTYIKRQVDGWNALENSPSTLQPSITVFTNTLNSLNRFIQSAASWNPNQLQNQWNSTVLNNIQNQSRNTYTYDCPETEFLIKVNLEQPEYNDAVIAFFSANAHGQNLATNVAQNLTGYLIAYEFIQKDHTKITERRNAEKASISKLRNDFSNYLSKSEEHLDNYLKEAKQKGEEYATAIDEVKATKESAFDNWYKEAKETHDTFVTDSKQHREDLEKTYRELLRLKSPAEYWSKRAVRLKRDGRMYMAWMVALVVFSAGLLLFLLGIISNNTIVNIFKNAGTAIKWSIVFVSFLSLLAYGIRILAKVSFSSFHLARDAEEREQLTYLYLALRKDGNVEDSDRQIVLQALFSRAETGLLKDDSSPTMPGSATSVVEKMMRN